MNVKYINIKMVDNKSWVWETIGTMGGKNFEFLYEIFKRVEGTANHFPAGFYKAEICEKLSIKHTTYWKRINTLLELQIIQQVGRGMYSLNIGWIKVLKLEQK